MTNEEKVKSIHDACQRIVKCTEVLVPKGFYFDYDTVLENLEAAIHTMDTTLKKERPETLPEEIGWSESTDPEVESDPLVFDGTMTPEDFRKSQEHRLNLLDQSLLKGEGENGMPESDAQANAWNAKGEMKVEEVKREAQEVKPPLASQDLGDHRETNFRIEPNGACFVVRSDSERFGKQAITFESYSREECVNYITEHSTPVKPKYYVIDDLSVWTDPKPGRRANIETFDTLKKAVTCFQKLREEPQDYSDGKAKLTFGMSLGPYEIDILHVREGQNYLVSDFLQMPRFNTNTHVLRDLEKLHSCLGFDRIRLHQNEQGDRIPYKESPKEIPFDKWLDCIFNRSGAKYWLSEEAMVLDLPDILEVQNPVTVYRIEALKDFDDVRKGDLGGYVQSEENLSHHGKAWIYANACAVEDSLVQGNAKMSGNALAVYEARLKDEATLTDHTLIAGSTVIGGEAQILGRAQILQEAHVMGQSIVKDDAIVGGYAVLDDQAMVAENDTFFDGRLNHPLFDGYEADENEEEQEQ